MKLSDECEYKCLKCGYEWIDISGPTQCLLCNYLYVKWINYEQWRKIHPEI